MLSRPFLGTSVRAAAVLVLLCPGASPGIAQELPPGALVLDLALPEGLLDCAPLIAYAPFPGALSVECQETPQFRVDVARRPLSTIEPEEDRVMLSALSDGSSPLSLIEDQCRETGYADPDAACAIATIEQDGLRGWIHDRGTPGAGPDDPSLATATILQGAFALEFYAVGRGAGGGSAEIRAALPIAIEVLTP